MWFSCHFMIYIFWAVLQRTAEKRKWNILWWYLSKSTDYGGIAAEGCQALLSKDVQRRSWSLQPSSDQASVLQSDLCLLGTPLSLCPGLLLSSQPWWELQESGARLWWAGSPQQLTCILALSVPGGLNTVHGVQHKKHFSETPESLEMLHACVGPVNLFWGLKKLQGWKTTRFQTPLTRPCVSSSCTCEFLHSSSS